MDRLVNKGVTFTHAFNQGSWAGAVCVPSRTMLTTGQTVFRAARNVRYLGDSHQLYGPAPHPLKKKPAIARSSPGKGIMRSNISPNTSSPRPKTLDLTSPFFSL